MHKPCRVKFLTLREYLSEALASLNRVSLTHQRYDLVCDIMRHACSEYPRLLHSPEPDLKLWEIMRKKLIQLAESGVRAVNIWWRAEWGACPSINLNGKYSKMYVTNRAVRRALRQRRLLVIRILWRAGLPQDIHAQILNCIGL